MWTWLQQQFRPRASDPKHAYREYFLLISLGLFIAGNLAGGLLSLIVWLSDPSNTGAGGGIQAISLFVSVVIYSLLFAAARRGWVRSATWILIALGTLGVCFAFVGQIEMHIGNICLALMLGVLLVGPLTGGVIAVLITAAYFITDFARQQGNVPAPPPISSTVIGIDLLIQLLLVVGLAGLAIRGVLQQLDREAGEARAARAHAEATLYAQSILLEELETRTAEQAQLLELVNELEVPIISVAEGVLVLPIVGALDTRRADQLETALLREIDVRRARIAILDITGVAVIDTAIARRLLDMARAVRLLGAQPVLSGIRANVAQTVVTLGVDLRGIRTFAELQDALESTLLQDVIAQRN